MKKNAWNIELEDKWNFFTQVAVEWFDSGRNPRAYSFILWKKKKKTVVYKQLCRSDFKISLHSISNQGRARMKARRKTKPNRAVLTAAPVPFRRKERHRREERRMEGIVESSGSSCPGGRTQLVRTIRNCDEKVSTRWKECGIIMIIIMNLSKGAIFHFLPARARVGFSWLSPRLRLLLLLLSLRARAVDECHVVLADAMTTSLCF